VRWHTPQTGGFLYRRQAMLDAGRWNPAQPCCQDNEMTLRLLMHGKRLVFCPSVGAVYRLWSHDTVSRRNCDLARQNRLKIIQTAEIFLRQPDRLTPTRQWAVNQARFEVARSYWPEDPNVALEIVRAICELHPGFRPGAPVPVGYRACYRLFGFRMTEKIAAWQRQRPSWRGYGPCSCRGNITVSSKAHSRHKLKGSKDPNFRLYITCPAD
jgi:hypothetical protein